jgi:iron complex transport system ATP-binding protein
MRVKRAAGPVRAEDDRDACEPLMAVIRLEDISYRRGDHEILSRLSWTIRRGQHWALLGANGAGKTTLLKIITGYEWVTEGTVEVLGEVFGQCNIPDLRKTIGWVSSALEHNLPARDTALAIVASGLEASIGLYRDFTPQEFERARETLALLGFAQGADQPYDVLSQGEKQRVLIARALVNRPSLLILDEPCAGLDPAAREAFLADLGRLSRSPSSPSLILVTHHIEEIGPWISHVLVIKAGRVLAAGPKADALTGAILGDAFGCPCVVETNASRYHLRMEMQNAE